MPDRAQRFEALYTGAITDVLDGLGLRQQTLPAEIGPMIPGMKVAGPAYPVQGRPAPNSEYDSSLRKILEMLGAVPAGHVPVYATGDRTCAQFGELTATSLHARNVVGAVLDGGCRDLGFIEALGFPVFAAVRTPQDSVGRWEVVSHGRPIEIGGVMVRPGDWVVGDGDGVVVVPASRVDEVLEGAEEVAGTEDQVRAAVRDGVPPLDAYERYGEF